MKPQLHLSRRPVQDRTGTINWRMLGRLALFAAIAVPTLAIADTSGVTQTENSVCSLLNSIDSYLNVISIVVVTIAIIFAGYQVAFAHKRIAEVAPVLIGGILIGAAGQIASLILSGSSSSSGGGSSGTCTSSSITPDIVLTQVASITHTLVGYLA